MDLHTKISEIFPILELVLHQNDLNDFKNTDKDNLYLYHFGLGLYIRNNLLSENNNLFLIFVENNIINKDDMSSYIIESFHKYLNK